MKPKTKIQKEVHALMCDLPLLTKAQVAYSKKVLFQSNLYKTKGHTTCLDCGHRWENTDGNLITAICGDECPSCGATLKQLASPRKRTNKQFEYICEASTKGGFQVFRFWYVEKNVKVGQKAYYYHEEVSNHWIRETDGKVVMTAMKWNAMGWNYGERWSWGSEIEIRANHDRYYIYPKKYFPNKKVLKRIRRNGYKGGFKQLQPTYFCELVLGDHKAETLLKSKQIPLFNTYFNQARNIDQYWASIKIAIRHQYIISHPSDWFDHLDILEYFNKDILNPSVICMDDFKSEHQALVERRNRVEAKLKYEREKEQIQKDEAAYEAAKKRFFQLKFELGDLCVAPLTSVAEFYLEGETLHHCVSKYHSKKDSLILSAQFKGKRQESVEVSLKNFTVTQSRGLQNKSSKHHKQIISLVESNMNKIKKASK